MIERSAPEGEPRPARRLSPETIEILVVLVLAALQFAYFYWIDSGRPGVVTEHGWYDFPDQRSHLWIAQDLAEGRLVAGHFFYGWGYPVLAAPFVRLFPTDPFLPVNLGLYVATLGLVYWGARVLLSRELAFAGLWLLSTGLHFTRYFIAPWSNSLTIAVAALLLMLALHRRALTPAVAVLIGLGLGLTLAARYSDVAMVAPLALAIAWEQRDDRHGWRRFLILSLGIVSVFLALTLWSHYVVFGSASITPYYFHLNVRSGIRYQDLAASHQVAGIVPNLLAQFVNPHPFVTFSRLPIDPLWDTPLLGYAFYFVLAPLGLMGLYQRRRVVALAALAGLVSTLLWMGSDVAGSTGLDLRYGSLRYFALWYPLLTVAALLGAQRLLRLGEWRRTEIIRASGVYLLLILALALGYAGVSIAKTRRVVPGIPHDGWKMTSNVAEAEINLAYDGDEHSAWTTQARQAPGQFVAVDLGQSWRLGRLMMVLGYATDTYPRGCRVETSDDGRIWQPVSGLFCSLNRDRYEARFDPVTTRYVRFVQTGEDARVWWSIAELYLFEP